MIIKHSIGGPITSIKDEDSIERKEDTAIINQAVMVIVCKKCGIQHAIAKDEKRICCGKFIESELS